MEVWKRSCHLHTSTHPHPTVGGDVDLARLWLRTAILLCVSAARKQHVRSNDRLINSSHYTTYSVRPEFRPLYTFPPLNFHAGRCRNHVHGRSDLADAELYRLNGKLVQQHRRNL